MNFFIQTDAIYVSLGPDSPESGLYISLDKANRLLRERGAPIECVKSSLGGWYGSTYGCMEKSHTALLICIEPIPQPDTAEKILKDFMSQVDMDFGMSSQWQSLVDRARKLIGGSK